MDNLSIWQITLKENIVVNNLAYKFHIFSDIYALKMSRCGKVLI